MLDFVTERVSVWDNIKSTDKKIVLYGMGNGADKILDWCEANNVTVNGVFASDEFVRGQIFRGFEVCRYQDIINDFGNNILIVLAFASERPEVMQIFKMLAARHEVVAPHLSLFDETDLVSRSWLKQYAQQLEYVYDKLADEQSRKVFADIINYKISGKIKYLFDCETERLSDLNSIFTFSQDEIYLDLGAYNGDTVKEFLQLTGGRYKKIIAVEPDRRNFKKLEAFAETLEGETVLHNKGIWQDFGELGFSDSGGRQSTFLANNKSTVAVDSIDHLAADSEATYIKMDVEGAEKQALAGGKNIISKFKPKMMIAAYHYDNDIFELPLKIWELADEYQIYLRKHPYIPAWEINFFTRI